MKKIVLCPNPLRDMGLEYTAEVKRRLEEKGVSVSVCSVFYSGHSGKGGKTDMSEMDMAIHDADLLICFGGDGTILHLAHAAAKRDIPILTVNMGNKGFIAELEVSETERLIEVAMSEQYDINSRMMLDVNVIRSGETILSDYALNDAVIVGIARIIDLAVYGDGDKISEFAGDGIIISTPTGSTAYSMAAGGPIVEPTTENIIVTPICAHDLKAKAFVLSPRRKVSVKISKLGGKLAYLSIDGGRFRLRNGDEITVSKSQYVTKIIKASGRSFYEILNDKLGKS